MYFSRLPIASGVSDSPSRDLLIAVYKGCAATVATTAPANPTAIVRPGRAAAKLTKIPSSVTRAWVRKMSTIMNGVSHSAGAA